MRYSIAGPPAMSATISRPRGAKALTPGGPDTCSEAMTVSERSLRCWQPSRLSFGRAVELAHRREQPIARIAKDLGISQSCLRRWMGQAGVEECTRRCVQWSHHLLDMQGSHDLFAGPRSRRAACRTVRTTGSSLESNVW